MSASVFELLAIPVELILDVADHLPASDLVHLAQSNRWLFRLLSPRIDSIALEYRVPGCSQRPSVLLWAVANNHLGLVKRLVALGAPIHGSRNGSVVVDKPLGPMLVQSALDLAIQEGHYEIAEFLMAQGADVNASDPLWFRTPLSATTGVDRIELAELLLNHGADPFLRDAWGGMTPLHSAAKFRSSALVEKLLSLGVDVNARDDFGRTPLHLVSRDLVEKTYLGQSDNAAAAIAKKLLEAGANRDIRTYLQHKNQTPLHLAAFHGNPTVLRVLLESGADVATTDALGCTALHLAASGEYDENIRLRLQVVKLLLQYGANVRTKDLNGSLPLDYAIKFVPLTSYYRDISKLYPVSEEMQLLLRP
jgi:ankyrin repeat protein